MVTRPLSVIYVENDPALRGLITSVLKSKSAIAEVFDFETGEEAIAFGGEFKAKVALIDISLGSQVMDGVAVGTALQRLNNELGIVLFTQHSLEAISSLVSLSKLECWSYFQKRADSDLDQLVEVLKETSLGRSVVIGDIDSSASANQLLAAELSSRQHLVLSMLATGIEPRAIAEKLSISFDSVRKDLSNAYSILVPNPEPGVDLRVTSILRYQQLTTSSI
ncbi:MAG: response regulator [Actinobacteria bacterium]|nr:response regulator [Actinomycetota bacterium]